MSFDPAQHPHRRRNLLTGDWVLVSPHRANRPWQGDTAPPAPPRGAAYDPGCYLCPGNVRTGGERNPDYAGAFVFANDFPALLPDTPAPPAREGPFEAAGAGGTARVICYAPDHAATMATLDDAGRRAIVECWCAQSADLGAGHAHVQIFENKGAMMGASSPHPHGQVWATDLVPNEPAREDARQRAWRDAHGGALLDVVVDAETDGERVIEASDGWIAFVPYWASWPFETLVVARRARARLEELEPSERDDLAAILGRLLRRYDGLFGGQLSYSMGWHGAPHALGGDTAHWRLHAHVYPPLLRSASVRKFMVGFEMLAEAQRDLTPEQAAARLRAVAA